MSGIQLIVGLANPGKEYALTRHNAGAWFIDKIAQQEQISLRADTKYHGRFATLNMPPFVYHLLVPSTFMNLSGQAVSACARYFKIPPSSILIAHDDLDLEVGTIKLKMDGGDGGHNGLKDIIRHLNTKQFYRLRIGIGRPPRGKDGVDYVLSAPSKADRQKIDFAIGEAEEILPLMLQGEMQKAMQILHTAN